ncbi:MAG TPA: molybdate ABC transporter permease subunit [Longimicrobiaceae bacterium]|nr:molybdate ABC transporter permease subunit [Longimicrobiaceae bacterium]
MLEWGPLLLSLRVAFTALIVVFVAGTLAARLMTRGHFPGKDILESLFILPLVLPPVVTGFLLLILLGRRGPFGTFLNERLDLQIVFTVTAAVLAAVVVSFPLMYQSAKAAFQAIDTGLEDAARTLGAGELRVFLTVTLPLAWPGLIAGTVLSFARSLGEFGATVMVAGNIPGKTTTIPLAIYFLAEAGELRLAGMYALIISAATMVLVVALNVWTRRKLVGRHGRGAAITDSVTPGTYGAPPMPSDAYMPRKLEEP